MKASDPLLRELLTKFLKLSMQTAMQQNPRMRQLISFLRAVLPYLVQMKALV